MEKFKEEEISLNELKELNKFIVVNNLDEYYLNT